MTPARLATAALRTRAQRGILAVAALSLVCNVAALAVPLFNMQIFNRVLTTRDLATLAALATGLAIAVLAWAILDTLRGLALERLATQLTQSLATPLLPAAAAEPRPVPAEALSDLETIRAFIASPASTAPFDLLWTPVLLIVLLAQHWGFAAAGALCCALLAALGLLGDALSRQELIEANEARAASLRQAATTMAAADAVVALGMLPTLRNRWESSQARATALVHRATLLGRAIAALTATLRMAMTGAMVALGLVLALGGMASGGAMVASNMILARLLAPFGHLAQSRQRWIDAWAAWQRIRTRLEAPTPRRYTHALPAPNPRLTVENLAYMAPHSDGWILRGVSFTIEPGESLGIIGPSSSGKSTLLRAILGMIEPGAGGVYLDGTNTYLWQREDFARHVGYVPQNLCLRDATVAENIAGTPSPDLAPVIAAAKRAGAHRMIATLPHGYATRIQGNALSSGQRQWIALARALYHSPSLLILDEPTAFLDEPGEARVKSLLATLRSQGTTIILVAHRPSLLTGMDKLLLLRDGTLAQFGPRTEILQTLTGPIRQNRPIRQTHSEAAH